MKIEDIIIAQNNISKSNVAGNPASVKGNNFSEIYEKSLVNFSNSNNLLNTSYDDIFKKASEAYDVPLNLLKAVAKAESGFNAKAVSSCGAQGIMQLMPKTAAALGVEDAFNPEQNIIGGAKYLGQMLENYNGDTTLALAAYNAGAGNVKKYGGVPPFKETQNYIAKVMDYAGQVIDTSQYKTQSGTKSLQALSDNSNLMSAALSGGVDSTILDGIISQNKTPDEEYITTMFLLNLMESQSKASSVGRISSEDEI